MKYLVCYIQKKIIKNKFAFNLWIKFNFLEKKIKFGEFQISGKNSIYNVTKKLLKKESLSIESLL